MVRKLASIVVISEVLPIEGADRLELAKMKGKGWQVVVQKGEFSVGDLCVYFEIDSFLNPEDERYAFLRDRCLRKFVSKSGNVLREGLKIKTIKLRGVISQGLLMPLDKFPELTSRIIRYEHEEMGETKFEPLIGTDVFITETLDEYKERIRTTREQYKAEHGEDYPYEWKYYFIGDHCESVIGADVTKVLRVEHYDEVKEQLQPAMGNPICADAMGRFPERLGPRSDEDRIQNLGDWFEKMKGRRFQVSCKHDGTSCTVAYSPTVDAENPDIVCSRNLRLKRETAAGTVPVYWQMAKKYDILGKLKTVYEATGKEYMIQGEVVGPGIQKARNKEMEYKFLCFRMWDIKEQKFVNPSETFKFCKEHDILHVQIIKDDFPFFDEITTMEEALKFAEGKTAEGNEREGVVLKAVDSKPFASCKIVSNRYLLHED